MDKLNIKDLINSDNIVTLPNKNDSIIPTDTLMKLQSFPNNYNAQLNNMFKPYNSNDIMKNVKIIERPTAEQINHLIAVNQDNLCQLEIANKQINDLHITINKLNSDLETERILNTNLTKKIASKNTLIGILAIVSTLFAGLCGILATVFS